jgi:hypothetical protein
MGPPSGVHQLDDVTGASRAQGRPPLQRFDDAGRRRVTRWSRLVRTIPNRLVDNLDGRASRA